MAALLHASISKKIRVVMETADGLPAVEADRSQIQQIFMNLVLNAAEAIGNQSGAITVSTGVRLVDQEQARTILGASDLAPGWYAYLNVKDTGCGMDRETQLKIFDPFFTTKFTGRGLGLAAVAGIVRTHRGAIHVTSAPGEGSCFEVLLPLSAGLEKPGKPEKPAAGEREQGAGTILVVDDEEPVRVVARNILEQFGYNVLVAESGPTAIRIFARHATEIRAVLLDLSMPEQGGEEILPELLRIRADARVVISSGYAEAQTMPLFQGQSVAGFIQKPYTARELVKKIGEAVASRGASAASSA